MYMFDFVFAILQSLTSYGPMSKLDRQLGFCYENSSICPVTTTSHVIEIPFLGYTVHNHAHSIEDGKQEEKEEN